MAFILVLSLILLGEVIPLGGRVYDAWSRKFAKIVDWGLGYKEKGQQPTGNTTREYLEEYGAYFVGDPDEKVIYLTFDAGYENGNTPKILDVLKKHEVPAAFFLVSHYIRDNKELSKRIADEGHLICNHTMQHPDMTKKTDYESFSKELLGLEAMVEELTGQPLHKFYRPPQGRFSEQNLKFAQQMGYTTVFWSMAYVDWKEDSQPDPAASIKKLDKRLHPGAILLLHSNSSTNATILEDLIINWKEQGYVFRDLYYLIDKTVDPLG